MAKCPAHGDRTPTLSIRVVDDGRTLLHCFAGCTTTEVCAALGIEVAQLFPASNEPWQPPRRPRFDPERDARLFFDRLLTLRAPPPAERMRRELVAIGNLILGGSKRFAAVVPPGFSADSIKTFPIRLTFQAIEILMKEGTPWHSFPPNALQKATAHVCSFYGDPAIDHAGEVLGWARLSMKMARSAARRRS